MRKDRMVSEVLGQEVALSPSDLVNAELKSVLIGGYDKGEVDSLLERAADAVERLTNENRRLRQQYEESREQLQQYMEMETTLRNALISSQKISETIVASAKAQADALLEEARLAKARAKFQMEELPAILREEIRGLRGSRERLRADIQAVLQAHAALLKNSGAEEELPAVKPREEKSTHFVSFGEEHADAREEEDFDMTPQGDGDASDENEEN